MSGKVLLEWIEQHEENPRAWAMRVDPKNHYKLYMFLNRAVNKDKLTRNDIKRLQDDFDFDAEKELSEIVTQKNKHGNNISRSTVYSQDMSGEQAEILLLKEQNSVLNAENKLLRERLEIAEKRIDGLINKLTSK